MGILIGEVDELKIDSESICHFYRKNWKRRTALSDSSFYRWLFMESPHEQGKDRCIAAIDGDSGDILGTMGITKRPFFLNGTVKEGAEMTTWVVDENHMGKGIGSRIVEAIQSRHDVLMGMGSTRMSLPLLLRKGFRYLRTIPRYLKVFDFDAIRDHAKYDSLAIELIGKWAELGCTSFDAQEINRDFPVCSISSVLQDRFNHFSRDIPFLEWRYSRHPAFDYKQFFVRSTDGNRGEGVYVCLREERSVEDLNLVHIMDCVGDEDDIPSAIGFIQHYCKENNIHLADFYCTSPRVNRFFIASGWLSINDDKFFQFPHLFHPLEYREPPTTSLVYWSNAGFHELADMSKLYVTKQDVDLDRPTLATFDKLEF